MYLRIGKTGVGEHISEYWTADLAFEALDQKLRETYLAAPKIDFSNLQATLSLQSRTISPNWNQLLRMYVPSLVVMHTIFSIVRLLGDVEINFKPKFVQVVGMITF